MQEFQVEQKDYRPSYLLLAAEVLSDEPVTTIMVGVETDSEAVMPNFSFDESKGIQENVQAFFDHLASYDEKFAAHLKAELPTLVGDGFDRAVFNKGVVEMLDDDSESEGKEA